MDRKQAGAPLLGLDAVVIDSETTGLDPRKARLIELAAVRLSAALPSSSSEEYRSVFSSVLSAWLLSRSKSASRKPALWKREESSRCSYMAWRTWEDCLGGKEGRGRGGVGERNKASPHPSSIYGVGLVPFWGSGSWMTNGQ